MLLKFHISLLTYYPTLTHTLAYLPLGHAPPSTEKFFTFDMFNFEKLELGYAPAPPQRLSRYAPGPIRSKDQAILHWKNVVKFAY